MIVVNGKTHESSSSYNRYSKFSAHFFKCRYKRFRQLLGPFRFGKVRQMGAPKGTGAHGVYGAIELRHDVPFHDVGQLVSALMVGK